VEAAIAGTIILVGMLALISLFPVSSSNLVASAATTEAVGLATQQIETMRNLQFPPCPPINVPCVPPTWTGTDTPTLQGVTYTRTWTVVVAGTTPNRRATITVTITWPGQRNPNGFITTTILAEG
jgi:Tfp pilus assembly protein PilV